uniref:Uncharacterized protein n=1 Tax=Magallana gigas TaxID=29159 RepID=A0A8W8L2J0_MAGGI
MSDDKKNQPGVLENVSEKLQEVGHTVKEKLDSAGNVITEKWNEHMHPEEKSKTEGKVT